MHSPTFSLFKVLFSNQFSVNAFFGDFKKGAKGVVKGVFISILAVYLIGCIAYSIVTSVLGFYSTLKFYDAQDALPPLILVSAFSFVILFGFLTISSTYFTGYTEEQLLSLPLKDREILSAKYFISLVTDSWFAVALLIAGSVIYGIKEGLAYHFSFYAGLIVSFVSFATLAIFLIYLVLILAIYFIPSLRSKKLLTVIAVIFTVVIMVLISSVFSRFSLGLADDKAMLSEETVRDIQNTVSNFKILSLFTSAIKGNWTSILILLPIPFVVVLVLLPAISGMYIKSLNGFANTKSQKMTKSEAAQTLQKDVKSKSLLKALYLRDVVTVLREPTFFVNGPLMIILMPIIMIFSMLVGFITASEIPLNEIIPIVNEKLSQISAEKIPMVIYYVTAGGSILTILMGSMTNVATTAFSREGKSLYNLKAMPIDYEIIINAKILHAFTYNLIAYLLVSLFIGGGMAIFDFPFPTGTVFEILSGILIFSFTVMAFINFIEMFMDTINPKLDWENPIAASKQNLNTLFAVLASFFILGLVGALLFVIPTKTMAVFKVAGFVFLIFTGLIGIGYEKYAVKKIAQL